MERGGRRCALLNTKLLISWDLWQWTTGLVPIKVHAFCHYGKYHRIEVEDDVTAYIEYENGATGVLIASTGEAWYKPFGNRRGSRENREMIKQ